MWYWSADTLLWQLLIDLTWMFNIKDVPMVMVLLSYFSRYRTDLMHAQCRWHMDIHMDSHMILDWWVTKFSRVWGSACMHSASRSSTTKHLTTWVPSWKDTKILHTNLYIHLFSCARYEKLCCIKKTRWAGLKWGWEMRSRRWTWRVLWLKRKAVLFVWIMFRLTPLNHGNGTPHPSSPISHS